MMKMNFSFASNKAKSRGVFTAFALLFFFLLSGFSLTAQSLTTKAYSNSEKTYSNDFPTKAVMLADIKTSLDVLRSEKPTNPLVEATNSVRMTFLVEAGKALKSQNMEPLAALTLAQSLAAVRAQDFNFNINTQQMFVEYYNLFSL
jgi:hypothetical protein